MAITTIQQFTLAMYHSQKSLNDIELRAYLMIVLHKPFSPIGCNSTIRRKSFFFTKVSMGVIDIVGCKVIRLPCPLNIPQ